METCAKSHYSTSTEPMSSPTSCSSLSTITPDISTSDSDTSENGGTSLLHQALKRKRTDSETEQLFKRQFFLTTAPPNQYFNTTVTNMSPQISSKPLFRPSTSVLPSPTRFITRPIQSTGIFNQQGTSTTRPIFHIIQAPNRNLKLSATHVELCQLLQQNKNISTTSALSTTSSTISVTTVAPTQENEAKEPESKN